MSFDDLKNIPEEVKNKVVDEYNRLYHGWVRSKVMAHPLTSVAFAFAGGAGVGFVVALLLAL